MRTRAGLLGAVMTVLLCLAGFGPAHADQATCDATAVARVETPAKVTRPASIQSTDTLLAAVPASADLMLFGDSLMARWSSLLPKFFPNASVFDFAVSGDRIANLLWRLDNANLTALKPRAMVLLIGTNDLGARAPGCAVAAGVDKVVGKLRTAWPDTPIFVLAITPRGGDFKAFDADRHVVNASIATLGQRFPKVYPVAMDDDIFTCGMYGKPPIDNTLPATPPGTRYSCETYVGDNLHYSFKGYIKVRGALQGASLMALGTNVFR